MSEWEWYQRVGMVEMRLYVPGESLDGISVSSEDDPQEGDMIARNPDNHNDQWLVAKQFFQDNYAPSLWGNEDD